MTLEVFVSSLREREIQLRTDGDGLVCDAPAGVVTQELLEEILRRKSDILEFLKRASANADDVVTFDRSLTLPTSCTQQRLWLLDQVVDDRAMFHLALTLRVRGALRADVLADTMSDLITHHESLHTGFHSDYDGIRPQIVEPYLVELSLLDIRDRSVQQRDVELALCLEAQARERFDLSSGRLLRAKLIALSDDDHVLAITLHRIAGDSHSLDILASDIASGYEARMAGNCATPREMAIQYVDFSAWQQAQFGGSAHAALLGRYKKHLAGVTSGSVLATDRPRPTVRTYIGAKQEIVLKRASVASLQALSVAEGIHTSAALLAVAKLLLFRYTRHTGVCVGLPVASRPAAAVQGVVGPFRDAVALCTTISADMSGRELLHAVQQSWLERNEFSRVPLQRIVDALNVQHDLSHHPLFQVVFQTRGVAPEAVTCGNLTWQRLDDDDPAVGVDLAFVIQEQADGSTLGIRYNSGLFDTGTITRMLGHFETLLESLVAAPDARLGSLPMLHADEIRAFEGWNSVAWNHGLAATVHELFERSAASTPDAPALVCVDGSFSYGDLNEVANRLAHRLAALGIEPGKRVGVHCRRNAGMVIALLATLKAGAAYVPIDPAYPRERIALMLDDAAVAIVLTQSDVVDSLPATVAHHLVMDRDDDWVRDHGVTANPSTKVAGSDLSHIIYTSGSTGRPKGTMIEHRNVLALLDWARSTYSRDDISGTLASTSICFDLSVFEIFVPLSFGGTVHLLENVLELPQYAGRERITLINTVPSALTQLLRTGGLPRSVRVVNLAGEPLLRSLVDMAYAQRQVSAVYNLYGPTEDTTYSTWVKVPRDGDAAPTIGIPLPGKAVHLLDADMQPVPVGVIGEIHIAGAGVARGYLNQPELSTARFIAHPLNGDRMYRTGDLGRYTPDGQINYLGRTDFQVKVRGFRIELGEVEVALRAHPLVQEAVAVARADQSGDAIVVAYVVLKEAAADLTALRAHLRSVLPGFMLPSSITVLDAIPLTLNGKVDRNALPDHERHVPAEVVPARSELERDIAVIWRDLLGGTQIGINDNFFEVGGHSLLALQMHGRLNALLGRTIPIMELFRHPTIRSLAEFLKGGDQPNDGFSEMQSRMNRQREIRVRRRNALTPKGN